MKTNSTYNLSIIRIASMLFLSLVLIFPAKAVPPRDSFSAGTIKLNPECKLKRMSSGEVIVFARNTEGQDIRHEFTDFYADLLMAAYRKQRMEFILDTFSRKYYLSEDDCRRELKHALNVLAEWNIVLRDNKIAVR
ncbi:MAG TPA: hypothetical protein VJ111_11020 [Chitinophagaceae bacterium]|nr:hypothetical protein [Chitinophagaceae bacterium]